jgi:hypothetical protein
VALPDITSDQTPAGSAAFFTIGKFMLRASHRFTAASQRRIALSMEDSHMRKKDVDEPLYTVALVKVEDLSDVAMRLATLAEALKCCRRIDEREERESRAVLLADKLPIPPFVGSCVRESD